MAVIFSTSNKHKFEEVKEIAGQHGVEVIHKSAPYVEIQADTLEEIAKPGAEEACTLLKSPCFVEDAGLFVKSLKGFPGPYSKFVFLTVGNSGLLKLLDEEKNRKAEFRSAVGYCEPGKKPVVFTGKVVGRISAEPRGSQGFGFDPVFIPDEGDGRSFGEMSTSEKNKFSHRARAVEAFIKWFKERKKS
jgi:XTP/dITP diphosphohydrolase